MRCLSILLLFSFLPYLAYGKSLSSKEKMELCYDELQKEFQNILKEEPEFIQLQATITAMKVAEKVLKRKNLSTQSLEAYAQSIIGPKTQEYIKTNQDKLNALYNKYAKEETLKDSSENILKSIETGERLSDSDLRKMMITLKTMQPDQFSFEESDYAITWFLDEVAKLDGSTNNFMSRAVKGVLDFDVYDPDKFKENHEMIATTLARAQKELAGRLAGVRASVFTKHKDICLDLYAQDNNNSSNQSIFAYCGYQDKDIVDTAFLETLTDIKHALLPKTVGFKPLEKPANNNEKRKIQDEINSLSSDKERVIAFYKSALNPKRKDCAHFAIVDKKKFTTEIYNNDGQLVTSLDSIVGSNRQDKIFNPDASLQLFQNGTYTRTTTAGIFHVMSVGDERKKNDYYKEEFNNQVLVLGKEVVRGDKLVEEEEKIMAIHGVPNSEWMGSDGKLKRLGNKKERMEAFTGNKNKKLSTGCVNLEGFSYEIMDELIPASCPIVVLPEDDKNFMYAKNFSLAYSTDVEDRFLGKENAHKKDESNKIVVDEKNFNRYNFSSPLRVSKTKKVIGGDENLQSIFEERQSFLQKYKNLESDDYELILGLSYAKGGNIEMIRENLDSMAKSLEQRRFSSKFQLLSYENKAKEILADFPIDEREGIIEKAKELVFE